MTITQTVDIPASRRLTIDVPREIPLGTVVITFTQRKLPQIPETMLLSEAALSKDWDSPEEDEAWADL